MEQGLTITRPSVESPFLAVEVMEPGYAIEKNPTPVSTMIVRMPSAGSILETTVDTPIMDGELESGRFVPYTLSDSEPSDTALTDQEKDEVVGLIEADKIITPSLFDSPEPTAEAPQEQGSSLLMAVRRSKLGKAAVIAAATVSGVLSFGVSSAKAETLEQQCADVALAKPSIVHPFHMMNAGIRPYTGYRYSQRVSGAVRYEDMPVDCAPEYKRYSAGHLQMLKNGNHWVTFLKEPAIGSVSNSGFVSKLFYQQYHTDPGYDYGFDNCTPGKGFNKVRIVLDNRLKDTQLKKTVEQNEQIFNAKVNGNCEAAIRSKAITTQQRAQGKPD